MRVGTQAGSSLAEVPETAERAEALGYDFLTSGETSQNAFFPLVLAAEHTRRVELRTSIALAFARSPMDTAYMAWDLQRLSNGRFALGLGSQVRGHVVRRFGMEWSPPAARMREYLSALRSIWSCWQTGGKLDVSTRHYSMNLMPPAFDPGPLPEPRVKLYIAAVNPRMLQVAGELCDGVLLHSFNTPEYTKRVVMPNLELGAGQGRPDAEGPGRQRRRLHRHRRERGGDRRQRPRHQGAHRLLRLHEKLLPGDGSPRMAGHCGEALPHVHRRQVVPPWPTRSPTRCCTPSPWSGATTRS